MQRLRGADPVLQHQPQQEAGVRVASQGELLETSSGFVVRSRETPPLVDAGAEAVVRLVVPAGAVQQPSDDRRGPFVADHGERMGKGV